MRRLIVQSGRGHLPYLARHRNAGLEIVLLLRGHLLWETKGRAESVRKGSVFFTLPGHEHGSAEEFEPGHEWCYIILAPPDNPRRILPALPGFTQQDTRQIENVLRRSRRHSFPATPAMQWLLPELVRELAYPGLHHAAQTANFTRAAVVELVRSIAQPADARHPLAERGPAKGLRKLTEQIIRAPEREWTLPGMAKECGLGRTRFAEQFIELTGDTPLRFVNRMRVRKACFLLRTTNWPVTRIAIEGGFESSQYFSAVFKKYTGGTPAGEYRRNASDN